MKIRIISIIILTISLYAIALTPDGNEISISKYNVSEVSPFNFLLDYQVKNTYDYDMFSKINITLPFEKYLLNGTIEHGTLKEKDFLFSQLDIDLNGNSDIFDSFKVILTGNKISIDGKQISPLIKTTANSQVLIPFNNSGDFNINRVSKKGLPFTLRKISSDPLKITIGLNTNGDLDFKKFSNSLLLIEIITSDSNAEKNLLLDGQKPFSGFINDQNITQGEMAYRFFIVKNVNIKEKTSSGTIKIEKIQKPFTLRVSYFFAISENLIILNSKISRED